MAQLSLELKAWKILKPDDGNALRVAFRFSLRPAEAAPHAPARRGQTFWTEVRLSRDLAECPGWREIDRESTIKAMYLFAVDRIVEAGRPVREAPLVWRAGARNAFAPPSYLDRVPFLPAAPVIFERAGSEGLADSATLARKAAGLD
jgi:hypothetical protein